MTSDERVEIAARLRATKAECDERGYPWMVEDLLQALGFETYEDGEGGIFDRLADLIDPTCHVVTSGEWRGRPIGSACSVCHAPLYPSTAWAHGMRYCAQCGSRVVDDDD